MGEVGLVLADSGLRALAMLVLRSLLGLRPDEGPGIPMAG
jgi:hypothetical protein